MGSEKYTFRARRMNRTDQDQFRTVPNKGEIAHFRYKHGSVSWTLSNVRGGQGRKKGVSSSERHASLSVGRPWLSDVVRRRP